MGYSLKDLASDIVKNDVEYVPQEVRKNRIDICKSCDKNKMNLCTECGCMIPLKTTLAKSTCPIGKW